MIARVEGADRFAIHRTYLRPDGVAKTSVEPSKAMLGGVRSGGVVLSRGPDALLVGEGIESTPSAEIIYGWRNSSTVAALSAEGMGV